MKKVAVVVLSILPLLAFAQSDSKQQYVDKISYQLEQPFGGVDAIDNLAQYINTVYAFALGIVGIIAVVLIMFGGLRWIAAAGNESIIGEAKEIITSAVVGLTIALLSYVILAFINPQFTTATLGVPKVPIPNEDNLIDLPKCDSTDFKGKTCTDVDTNVSSTCEEITCGHQAVYNGTYCRGVACADEGGCYRGPADPMVYSCQNTYCGQYAQNCADSGYKKMPSADVDFTSAYNECTCPYYEDVVAKNLGMTDLRQSVLTDEQEAIFYGFCTETNTQDYWETAIAADPAAYGYTLGASSTPLKGWNCGFGCYNSAQAINYTGGEIYVNCPTN